VTLCLHFIFIVIKQLLHIGKIAMHEKDRYQQSSIFLVSLKTVLSAITL